MGETVDVDLDAIQDRPVELLQRLLRFDTSNPPGNERECIDWIRGLLENLGCEVRIVASEADRPNLTLQVLPLDTWHRVFGESFVIFRFGTDTDPMLQDVVSTEHLRNGYSIEDERETYLHRLAFDMLAGTSLDPASSKALILDSAETHWSGVRRD